MLTQARSEWQTQELLRRYAEFIIGLSPQPVTINLRATHDDTALMERLKTVASFVDKPAAPPSFLSESGTIEDGRPGYVTDVEASIPTLRAALYRPNERTVQLQFVEQLTPEWGMYLLEHEIQKQLDSIH